MQTKKKYSNTFRIHIFFFLSYSFGIETINTFIHSVVPLKTIPDSRPKLAKCVPVFRPKRHKNPTRWGGTYLYSLFMGVTSVGICMRIKNNFLFKGSALSLILEQMLGQLRNGQLSSVV